jgi:hypothetical protein
VIGLTGCVGVPRVPVLVKSGHRVFVMCASTHITKHLIHCIPENHVTLIFFNEYLPIPIIFLCYFSCLCVHFFLVTVRNTCEGDGLWGSVPTDRNIQWTNYSSCSILNIIERRLYMRVAAYAVTAVAVLPALVIFHLYRYDCGMKF